MNNELRVNKLKMIEKNIKFYKQKIEEANDMLKVIRAEIIGEMQENGVISEEAGAYMVQRRKGSLSVIVEDPEKLPHNLRVESLTYTPNKKIIKEIINAGHDVDGVRLERGKETIAIKRRGL